MMLIAAIVAVALQLAVVEIPFMGDVFSTSDLTVTEWLITANHTPLPVMVFIILRKFSPSVENCEIIAVYTYRAACRPVQSTDNSQQNSFSAGIGAAAEQIAGACRLFQAKRQF